MDAANSSSTWAYRYRNGKKKIKANANNASIAPPLLPCKPNFPQFQQASISLTSNKPKPAQHHRSAAIGSSRLGQKIFMREGGETGIAGEC